MDIIKINCDKVHKQGEKYVDYSQEFKNVQKTLKDIKQGVAEAWTSDENVNFLSSFEGHINYMDNFIGFIDNKGELLKKASDKHDESEKEFINQMERSDLKNGSRDRY